MEKLFNWSRAKVKHGFIQDYKEYIRIGSKYYFLLHYKDSSKHTILVLKTKRKEYIINIWN